MNQETKTFKLDQRNNVNFLTGINALNNGVSNPVKVNTAELVRLFNCSLIVYMEEVRISAVDQS